MANGFDHKTKDGDHLRGAAGWGGAMMNRRVSLATAMALVGMQTTKEPTPPTDEEVARELIEQQERAKRKQMEDLDRVLMLAEAYRTALTPMPPGKARRSKRAQRAKARGW